MRVTIHQPEHWPWLGFFDKAQRADVLVILDNVPFRKNYFQNRNRIRSAAGAQWLTVPVLISGHTGQLINEVVINNAGEPHWRKKHFVALRQNYGRAEFWRSHEDFIAQLYEREWALLSELNVHIVSYLLKCLSIETAVVRSSELAVSGTKSELLLDVCKKLDATEYLSGISGQEYLNLKAFENAGVGIQFQEFHHPIYKQCYSPFVPCLSVLDLLLNHGPASGDIINGIGVETIDEVFK